MATNESADVLRRMWAEHQNLFRVGSFGTESGAGGLVIVNRHSIPAEITVLVAEGDKIRGLRTMLGEGIDPGLPASTLAGHVLALYGSKNIQERELVMSLPPSATMRMLGLVGDRHELAERSVQLYIDSFENISLPSSAKGAQMKLKRLVNEFLRDPAQISKLTASEVRRFDKDGVADFRTRFKPEVLKVLSASEDFNWDHYSFFAAEGEEGDFRRQGAEFFPLFATRMNKQSVAKVFGNQVRLKNIKRENKDREAQGLDKLPVPKLDASLPEALQSFFGKFDAKGERVAKDHPEGQFRLQGPLLKRLQGLAWPTNGLALEKLVNDLIELPVDWLPKDRAEWDAFCDITATVGTILQHADVDDIRDRKQLEKSGMRLKDLYSGYKGSWTEFRERMAVAFTDSRPPEGTTETEFNRFEREIGDGFDALRATKTDQEFDTLALKVLERVSPPDRIVELEAKGEQEEAETLSRIWQTEMIDWFRRRCRPVSTRERLKFACVDALDMARVFTDKVGMPLIAQQQGMEDGFLNMRQQELAKIGATRLFFSGKSVINIFELSRHFHSQREHIMEAGCDADELEAQKKPELSRSVATDIPIFGVPDYLPEDGWAPMCDAVEAPNGVWIVPLCDPRQLSWEGTRRGNDPFGIEGLNHCVGGYSNACRVRGHHILSFRRRFADGSFQRLSTLEIGPLQQGNTNLHECQHRARSNGTPCAASMQAKDWFYQQVRAGMIPLNFEGVQAHLGALNGKRDEIERACGYDRKDPEKVRLALHAFSDYYGKRLRKVVGETPECVDLSGFYQLSGMEDIGEEIYPTRLKLANGMRR